MATAISVLVVDDHQMVAEALRLGLSRVDGVDGVECVGTLSAALSTVERHPPDVILLDYDLPGEDVIAGIEQLAARHPSTKILVFTGRADEHSMSQVMRAGCAGYVVKGQSLRELAEALKRVHAGEAVFEPSLLGGAVRRLSRPHRVAGGDLSARELDVLRLLAEGRAARQVAEQLHISVNTARNHIQNVITKLHAHSRLEAVANALREGLIEPP